jgi:hypothetical protein
MVVVEKSSTSPKIEGRLLCIVGCRRRRIGPRALKELAAQVGGIARDGCFEKEKVGYSSTVSMSGEVFVPPVLLNEILRAKCCVLGDFWELAFLCALKSRKFIRSLPVQKNQHRSKQHYHGGLFNQTR